MKKIQILGTGCAKCEKLFANAKAAVAEYGAECEVEKISDIGAIVDMGVMMTPALVIDGEIKTVGKVLSPEDILGMLKGE